MQALAVIRWLLPDRTQNVKESTDVQRLWSPNQEFTNDTPKHLDKTGRAAQLSRRSIPLEKPLITIESGPFLPKPRAGGEELPPPVDVQANMVPSHVRNRRDRRA